MNKQNTIILCVLASLALKAEAAIKKDGLWTGKDWYNNAHKIGVKDGVPYSNDEAMNRFLKSPLSYDGPIRDDWMTLKNVQLVNSIFPEEDWDVAFPHAHSIYTHENFLMAVSRFPAFCNETSESTEDDPNFEDALEQTCKRELATLFAHWGQETGKRSPSDGEFWTQALYYTEEINKSDYKAWNWSNNAWPNQNGVQYYGRGPMQLSWNYNYGQFSNVYSTSTYDSKLELLRNPEKVSNDGAVAMQAGLWFYMTPQDPKPSIHDITTGFFVPNTVDLNNNMTASFASTINVINGGIECGKGMGTDKVKKRGEYFQEWLNFFGLEFTNEDLDCGNQPANWPAGSSSDVTMFFDKDWSKQGACKLVSWMTQYSAIARDDYKRCVCDSWGNGKASCEQGEDDTSNQIFVEVEAEEVEEVVEEVEEEEVQEEEAEEVQEEEAEVEEPEEAEKVQEEEVEEVQEEEAEEVQEEVTEEEAEEEVQEEEPEQAEVEEEEEVEEAQEEAVEEPEAQDDAVDEATEETTEEEQSGNASVWKTWATLQQIRDTPHYSKTSYSRTLYQVDRELDFIEEKMKELVKVAMLNGLI